MTDFITSTNGITVDVHEWDGHDVHNHALGCDYIEEAFMYDPYTCPEDKETHEKAKREGRACFQIAHTMALMGMLTPLEDELWAQ